MKSFWRNGLVLMVGFGALVACNGGGSNPNLGITPKVSGKINGYSGGAKVLKVFIDSTAIGTPGTLNADGSFSVDLPTIPDASLSTSLTPSTCTSGTFTINPSDVKAGAVTVKVFPNAISTTSEGTLTQAEATPSTVTVGTKQTLVVRIFANKDTTIATNNCVSGSSTVNGSWNLKTGYNEVFQTLETVTVTPDTRKFTIGMGTEGKPWRIDTSIQAFGSSVLPQ